MSRFARFINRVLVAAGIRKPSPAPKLKLVGVDLRVGEPAVLRIKAEHVDGAIDRPAERLGAYQDVLRTPSITSNDLVNALLIASRSNPAPSSDECRRDHEPQQAAVERDSCSPSSSSDWGSSSSSSSYDSCSSSSDSSYSDSSSSSSCSSDY